MVTQNKKKKNASLKKERDSIVEEDKEVMELVNVVYISSFDYYQKEPNEKLL